MQRARPRARRSRYNVSYRLTRSVPAVVCAPLLSILAVTIDPASSRVSMVSIPRDFVVRMQLQSNPNRVWINKINAAYEVPYVDIICCVASQYQGRDGGGHAAESVVGTVTGLTFDRYIAVDFVAFRDMVNALGGVDVCLTTNLDDLDYPDSNTWFLPIHFHTDLHP